MTPDELADAALAWMATGENERAVEALAGLVVAHPDVDRYHYRLGLALSSTGRRNEARRHLGEAVRLNPGFDLFHHSYLDELAIDGDPGSVVSAYDELGGFAALSDQLRTHVIAKLASMGAPLEEIRLAIPMSFGKRCVGISVTSQSFGNGVVRIVMGAGGYRLEVGEPMARNFILIDRLLAFRGYLDRLAEEAGLDGSATEAALLCLDDLAPAESGGPMMCFSSANPDHVLVPDCAFLGSGGYAHLHALAAQHARTWSDREPRAYWRGALTGLAGDLESALALPRVRLCEIESPLIDAKITSYNQYAFLDPELGVRLRAIDGLGEREGEENNFRFKYQLDIDGNSNSWPGLYLKLLTGGCVIKLLSDFRQWYYGSLESGGNILGTRSIEEIPSLVEWCVRNDDRAEAIGRAGRELAVSLTADSEYRCFKDGWRRAAVAAVRG